MSDTDTNRIYSPRIDADTEAKFLTSSQLAMIDEALGCIGEYGEVRLIVEKGRLRFVVTQQSFDALKWRPGSIRKEHGL